MKHILCIAAHDTSSGAGVIRDCLVAHDFNLWPHAVITALTCQSFNNVENILPISPETILNQLDSIIANFPVSAVKVGMIYNKTTIIKIAEILKNTRIPIVVDPVMQSSSGKMLISDDAISPLIQHLLPIASIVTPNRLELEIISSGNINSTDDAIVAARNLCSRWGNKILVKGGHFDGLTVTDFLISEKDTVTYEHPREKLLYSHGTGCVLSTALTCCLANSLPDQEALSQSTNYTLIFFRKMSLTHVEKEPNLKNRIFP